MVLCKYTKNNITYYKSAYYEVGCNIYIFTEHLCLQAFRIFYYNCINIKTRSCWLCCLRALKLVSLYLRHIFEAVLPKFVISVFEAKPWFFRAGIQAEYCAILGCVSELGIKLHQPIFVLLSENSEKLVYQKQHGCTGIFHAYLIYILYSIPYKNMLTAMFSVL